MEIIKTSRDLTIREKYAMTKGANVRKMSDCAGVVLEIEAWALYKDWNEKDQKDNEILSILTKDKEIFATISETFKREFFDMWDMFVSSGETLDEIAIVSGTSKAGRPFITCTLAEI